MIISFLPVSDRTAVKCVWIMRRILRQIGNSGWHALLLRTLPHNFEYHMHTNLPPVSSMIWFHDKSMDANTQKGALSGWSVKWYSPNTPISIPFTI